MNEAIKRAVTEALYATSRNMPTAERVEEVIGRLATQGFIITEAEDCRKADHARELAVVDRFIAEVNEYADQYVGYRDSMKIIRAEWGNRLGGDEE